MPRDPGFPYRRAIGQLNRYSRAAQLALRQALYEDLVVTMEFARDVYVPVDTGRLRETGYVRPVRRRGNRYVSSIEWGGSEESGEPAPYATYVYFRSDVYHVPPTQAYWMYPVLAIRTKGQDARMARRMNATLRRWSVGIAR